MSKKDDEDGGEGQEMEADAGGDEARFGTEAKAREAKVNQLVAQNRAKDAVLAALENPPLGTKSDAVKDQSAEIVVAALNATKDADLKGILDSLNEDQLDLLMKYVYRGMANADNSTQLLKVHAQIVEKAGLGCIIRAFAERKTVV